MAGRDQPDEELDDDRDRHPHCRVAQRQPEDRVAQHADPMDGHVTAPGNGPTNLACRRQSHRRVAAAQGFEGRRQVLQDFAPADGAVNVFIGIGMDHGMLSKNEGPAG